jgi:hypothetical protein
MWEALKRSALAHPSEPRQSRSGKHLISCLQSTPRRRGEMADARDLKIRILAVLSRHVACRYWPAEDRSPLSYVRWIGACLQFLSWSSALSLSIKSGEL